MEGNRNQVVSETVAGKGWSGVVGGRDCYSMAVAPKAGLKRP